MGKPVKENTTKPKWGNKLPSAPSKGLPVPPGTKHGDEPAYIKPGQPKKKMVPFANKKAK